jgi:hypothetical protein
VLRGRIGIVCRGGLPERFKAGPAASMPLLLATESPRFKPGAACTLHLLLTLSERFIMALSTKPPRPLVGEGGLLDDPQPGKAAEDISAGFSSLVKSILGASIGVDNGLDDAGVATFECTAEVGPSILEFAVRAFCVGNCGFANAPSRPGDFSGSVDCSRDMPGSLILRPIELSESLSLSLRLYAAEPTPLSAVCRKKVGSFDPRDFAIWLLDISASGSALDPSVATGAGTGAGDPEKGRGRDVFESLEDGLCCHERVPLLAKEVAVGGVGAGVLAVFCGGVGNNVVAVVSGKSFKKRGDCEGSILGDRVGVCICEGGVNSTGGSIGRLAIVLDSVVADELGAGEDFEGDIDRALSKRARLVSPVSKLSCVPKHSM